MSRKTKPSGELTKGEIVLLSVRTPPREIWRVIRSTYLLLCDFNLTDANLNRLNLCSAPFCVSLDAIGVGFLAFLAHIKISNRLAIQGPPALSSFESPKKFSSLFYFCFLRFETSLYLRIPICKDFYRALLVCNSHFSSFVFFCYRLPIFSQPFRGGRAKGTYRPINHCRKKKSP